MTEQNYNDFIKKYRKSNRITQSKLASHLGFTSSHLSQIEAGEKAIKKEKFKRIVKAINELASINQSLVKQAQEILKS